MQMRFKATKKTNTPLFNNMLNDTYSKQKDAIYEHIQDLLVLSDHVPEHVIENHDKTIRNLCLLVKQYEITLNTIKYKIR